MSAASRPPVRVIVPFFGSREEAAETLELLGSIVLRDGDRAVLADNTPEAVAAGLPTPPGVEVLVTEMKRSAYGARNEAAAASDEPWLLFLDADCRPEPGILDAFFEPAPGERTALVSGAVGGLEGQPGFAAAYSRSRNHADQARLATEHVFRPMAITANVLVRREAWEAVGGFAELVRSGADGDFCWRVQELGWALEHRPAARAPHVHRSSARALLRKAMRDGAANPWVHRRWPGYPKRMGALRQVVRAGAGVPMWLLRGQPSKAAFKAFDVVWTLAADAGGLVGNRIPREPLRSVPTALVARLGDPVPDGYRVEALARPLPVQNWRAARVPGTWCVEDDGPLDGLRAALRLGPRALRHPRLAPAALRLRLAGGELWAGPGAEREAVVLRRLAGGTRP